MAVIRMNEVGKLSAAEAERKIVELERALLENEGEGKRERRKPLKTAIARLKTHISLEQKKGRAAATPVSAKKAAIVSAGGHGAPSPGAAAPRPEAHAATHAAPAHKAPEHKHAGHEAHGKAGAHKEAHRKQ